MSGKEEIMSAMEQFERLQEKYLPKVDRKLILDLLPRLVKAFETGQVELGAGLPRPRYASNAPKISKLSFAAREANRDDKK